jgi:hypothetical protein
MNQTEFLNQLSLVSNSYTWTHNGTSLLGVAKNGYARGLTFNPITALARSKRLGDWQNNSQGTKQAARALGLSSTTVSSILSSDNRGNAQVVRGRMLNSLGVS